MFEAHEVKSTCTERFLSLILLTRSTTFYVARSRSAEDIRMGEKQCVIAWSMKSEEGGIGPVKPVHMVFSNDESLLTSFC